MFVSKQNILNKFYVDRYLTIDLISYISVFFFVNIIKNVMKIILFKTW